MIVSNLFKSSLKTASKFNKTSLTYNQIRNLHLHEYQAADVLSSFGLPVLKVIILMSCPSILDSPTIFSSSEPKLTASYIGKARYFC